MRLLLLVLVAASASANWWSRLPGVRPRAARIESISKPLTTTLVIVLAATSGAPGARLTIAVVALTLCLAGDVALMEPIDDFVLGLGAFLLAHLAFIALFVRIGLGHGGLAVAAVAGGVVVAAAVGRPILLAARRSQPALTVPVAAYLAVILTMAAVGWATGRGWVIAGSSAFVVSDALLGWEAFVLDGDASTPNGAAASSPTRFLPVAVMITYHLAIVSLAVALWGR